MQALLADRFHLAVHNQTADAPVFALVLVHPGATGPHLQPHPPSDECATPATDQTSATGTHPTTASSAIGDLPPACGVIAHVPTSTPGQHYGGRAVSLSLFATSVPTMTGLAATPRPVVDQTGLSGLYDFTLTWIHDPSGDQATSDNIASFREALKAQLGLELKPSTLRSVSSWSTTSNGLRRTSTSASSCRSCPPTPGCRRQGSPDS